MSPGVQRRSELATFLRSRREHLTPDDVGLRRGYGGARPVCAARRSHCWPGWE
ncbi:hypothetical protein [Nonomuraea sp. SYSU D8015]|uniref:hypothetical protein n=1 Tax=Nonomuraea sp. SYSU D8015 TaxID=2593644 RepID=UPI001CB6BBC0|nr:hypothetical protein [Nonomuraea sp. SYSU D8015]